MGLFRKKETYNEQMLREAGLDRVVFNTPEPPLPVLGINLAGLTPEGRLGPKAWDAATTAVASGIRGEHVKFTCLPNGDLILTSEDGDGDLSPLADAIEEHVSPPYKAAASRQDGDLWGVGAKRIEVAQFELPDAEMLELSQSDGVAELRIDGEPTDTAPPVELQRLGERGGEDFCVEATRIDADFWEVKVTLL